MRLTNLQQQRPSIDGATAALYAIFFPSGLIPNEEDSGRRSRPFLDLGGELEIPACFLKYLSEVICFYYLDPIVIFIFAEVVLVTGTTAWI
jgi:hypothetical protein